VYNEDTFLVRTPTLISYYHICMCHAERPRCSARAA
jgi:hypothetical protein